MRRAVRMPVVALVVALSCVGGLGGVAWAAFTSTTTSSQVLGTLTLGNPPTANATATATTPNACTSITITWPAVASADAYRIQVRVGGGAWSDLVTETGNVTSHVDAATRTNQFLDYRVYARDAGSNWEGSTPATTAPVTCGVAPITDLVVTNPCSSTAVTWTAPPGANRYDVQRRINGGGWTTVATDQTATSFDDPTLHPNGALVEYQVRPGSATADGDWALDSLAGWQPFRILSIVVANSGTLGTLNSGDTITVAFTKPILRSSIPVASIRTERNGGSVGLSLATSAAGTTGVGRLTTANNFFGATGTYAGANGWADADATYVWTSSVAGSTMTGALSNQAFSFGIGPRCAADSTALVTATQPTASGRW